MPEILPDDIDLKPLPFEEAVAYFGDKLTLTAAQYYALADEIRAKAFTVARVTKMDVLVDIKAALDQALSAGETMADFAGRLTQIMEARGWQGLAPWHLETVFRNNIQTAYSVGRYKQMTDQRRTFPYWQYDAVNDSRTRPTHAALDGKIFPADHPFWDTWYPPNGHRCRCTVQPLMAEQVADEGLAVETADPTNTLIEPVDARTGQKLPARYLLADPGFDTNPAKDVWQPDLDKYPAELRRQFEQDRG